VVQVELTTNILRKEDVQHLLSFEDMNHGEGSTKCMLGLGLSVPP
jgi:hypothetical protein